MAENDLSIIVKTKVEADEAQAQQEIKKLEGKIGKRKGSQLKVPIDVDKQASRANIQDAVSKLTQSIHSKPIKAITLDVDRVASIKNIKTAISEIQGKLSNQKSSKIKIGFEAPKSVDIKKEVEKSIKEAEKAQKRITKASQPRPRDASRAVNRFKTSTENSLRTLQSRAFNRKKPLTGADADTINNYVKQIKTMLGDVGDTVTEQTKNEISKLLNQAQNALSEIRAKAETATDFRTKDVLNEKSIQRFNLDAFVSKLKTAGAYTSDLQDSITDLYESLDKVNDAKGLEDFLNKLDEVKANARSVFADIGSQKSDSYITSSVAKLQSQLKSMKVNWTQALEIPEFRARMEEIESMLGSVDNNLDLSKARNALMALRADIKAAGADCLSFGGQLKNIFSKLSGFVSTADIVMTIRRGINTAVDNVKKLNSAMVELKKVTDLTDSAYDKFLDKAGGRAKDVGTTLTDYVSGAADFSRLGYDLQDATTMSEAANIYYKVGDQISNIEEATESLISTTQAYGYTASDVMTVVDKLNAAGNAMAISSGGIGIALQHSAAALSAANNTLDESIALIAAANRVVQDPSAVGNMWKTVSMRIRSAKAELEEAGEDTEGLVESTAQLQSMVKGIANVDILEADGKTFRSTKDIVLEIGEAWDGIKDIDQAALLEALAGKRQGNALAATLDNIKDIKKSIEVTENSAGSAMTEHQRWMESIEASEAQAAAAFEELSSKIMSSDLIKGFYDTETSVAGFLSNIIDLTDSAIPLVSTLAAALLSLKGNIGISKVNMPHPTCLGAVA